MLAGGLEDNVLTALVWNERLGPQIALKVKSTDFTTDVFRRIAGAALDFLEQHHCPARIHIADLLEHDIKKGPNGRFMTEIILEMERLAPQLNEEHVSGTLDRFLDIQGLTKAVNDASDFLTSGDLEQARAVLGLPATVEPAVIYEPPWPTLGEGALYGLAGEVVRTIAPHTEADPAAILFQFLTAFGNYVGRGPYIRVEADKHHANLYVVLVGRTSKGRKGTSWGWVRSIFSDDLDDTHWRKECLFTGALGSGEGIIHRLRDRDDDDANEKRLLVMVSEFATQLKIMERPGNTISGILRDAWDLGDLRSPLIKTSQERATGAHVSMVSHITLEELRRCLTTTEIANGFANRHNYVCVKRAQLLPMGGSLDRDDLAGLARQVFKAAAIVEHFEEIAFDPAARELWESFYGDLSQERDGLLGAVTGRAEAQVRRMALIYTLLDGTMTTREEHLYAAIEAWAYCFELARHVFGQATGDVIADAVLNALRRTPQGLTRSEIGAQLLSGHYPSGRIDQTLTSLQQQGYVESTTAATGQRGRPGTVWRAKRA